MCFEKIRYDFVTYFTISRHENNPINDFKVRICPISDFETAMTPTFVRKIKRGKMTSKYELVRSEPVYCS